MACGSKGLYDQALADGCSLQLLKNGDVKKIFDTVTTTVTVSTAGNIKLISAYPEQIVILSDADLLLMGFATRTAFMTFYNAIRSVCFGSVVPAAPLPIMVPATALSNANSQLYVFNVPGVLLGGNNNIVPSSNIEDPIFDNIQIEPWVSGNGVVSVKITNHGGSDVTIPAFNFNLFINP